MYQTKEGRSLTAEAINDYSVALQEDEKSVRTIQKYIHDLNMAAEYFEGAELTKATLIEWKNMLVERYAAATVNTVLAAINGFLKFMGWNDLTIKPLKIQQSLFSVEEQELTYVEYKQLVHAAENACNRRLSLVIQTICATGIRVSELQFITVEAVRTGRTEIANKGKRRTIFLPEKLRRILNKYIRACSATSANNKAEIRDKAERERPSATWKGSRAAGQRQSYRQRFPVGVP